MSKRVFPLTTKVLVRPNTVETVTSSGIVISGGDTGDYRTATALAVGPDVKHVKEGYTLYINWNKALDIKIDGEIFCVVDEDDVIALIDAQPVKE